MLLENSGDGYDRNVFLDRIEGLQHVAAHVELDAIRQHQRAVVDLWAS